MTRQHSAPLETVSLVEAATARLRNGLLAGEYAAGEEIKGTRIAAALGIARPTARAALQHLTAEGLLIRPPGLSARVRAFEPEQVIDLYRVRRLIEIEAIREIRARALPLDRVEAALNAFSELKDGEDDWPQIARIDVSFHSAVVETCGSPRLASYFAGIAGEIRLLIALYRSRYAGGEPLYREHARLFALLESAPVEQVEAEWTAHLETAQQFLIQHLG